MEESLVTFARLVKSMRGLQQEYFRSGNRAVLERSKELERRVDVECERILDVQLRLFEEGE